MQNFAIGQISFLAKNYYCGKGMPHYMMKRSEGAWTPMGITIGIEKEIAERQENSRDRMLTQEATNNCAGV